MAGKGVASGKGIVAEKPATPVKGVSSVKGATSGESTSSVKGASTVSGAGAEKPAASAPKNNIVAEEVPAGIRLSIRDIKFAPDSAQVLPGESSRLDEIAEVLKMAPNAQLLVEGHTASVGKPAGEQTLSEHRAKKIAEELKARGVKAGAFICRGFGGTKPVASNETPEGRAQNRRVEITILK